MKSEDTPDGGKHYTLNEDDLKVTVWPVDGEDHPLDPENIVEESIHARFWEMATKHVN